MSGFCKKVFNLALFIFLCGNICNVYAKGLSTLIEVGKSQAAMEKELKKETKTFQAIKNAVESGGIKKGQSQKFIEKKYGEPVIILKEKGGVEKWLYKPGNVSHFGGIKIYLFFNTDKKLTGIKMLKR